LLWDDVWEKVAKPHERRHHLCMTCVRQRAPWLAPHDLKPNRLNTVSYIAMHQSSRLRTGNARTYTRRILRRFDWHLPCHGKAWTRMHRELKRMGLQNMVLKKV